jgi:hypothetical protein
VTKLAELRGATWLVFLQAGSLEGFETVYIPFDCDFLVAHGPNEMTTGRLEVPVLEVYHIVPQGSLQIHRIGVWMGSDGFTWASSSYFGRRGNLHGVTIKAAVYPQVG